MKFSLAVAATLLAAGMSAAAAEEPIKIGYAISKTGPFAPAAHTQINTYELWQDQVNAAGGIDVGGKKRPVKFISYDDQSDFGKAPQIYEKLITDDKVDLLLAPWGTPFHFAIAGILEKYQFPLVGNSAASVTIREIKPGNIWFPTSAIPDRLGAELAKFLVAEKVKTAAVTTLQLPFSLEVKKYLMPALEQAGIKVVVNDEYAPDVKDLTATLTKIKQAAPDAILSLSYPPDSILFIKGARELDIKAPFQLALVGPADYFFSKMFGPNLDGIVTMGHWSPHEAKWPKAMPFYEAYKKKFNEPPDYLELGAGLDVDRDPRTGGEDRRPRQGEDPRSDLDPDLRHHQRAGQVQGRREHHHPDHVPAIPERRSADRVAAVGGDRKLRAESGLGQVNACAA